MVRSRAQERVYLFRRASIRGPQLREKEVRNSSFLVFLRPRTNLFQLGDLVNRKFHRFIYDEPPDLTWLMKISPPLMVTAPSSGKGVSFPLINCSSSSAAGTSPTFLISATVWRPR